MRLSKYLEKIPGFFVASNCLGMLLLSAVLVAVGYYTLQGYTHHGESVTVPDVRGKNAKEAVRILRNAGLAVEVSDTDYVATKRADIILAQSITAGAVVKPGRLVHLTINAARPLPVALPDLADNSSMRQAQALLKSLGFDSVRIEWINGDKEWVFAMAVNGDTVAAGTRVSTDTPIVLRVGNGNIVAQYNSDQADGEIVEYVTDTIPVSQLSTLGPDDIVLDAPEILVEEIIEE